MIAALLLLSVAWGTTVELTHNHGLNRSSVEVRTGASDTVESVQSESTTDASSKSKSAAECLICQLHQNLSTTSFSHALAIASTETISVRSAAAVILHRADFSKNQRGRAPPLNL